MFIQIHITQEELEEMNCDEFDLVNRVIEDLEAGSDEYSGFNVEVNVCEL